jgi:hypothetical protein
MALGLGLVALVSTSAVAGSAPGTGIRGSKHDMSATTGIGFAGGAFGAFGDTAHDPLQRVCIYCHAPHHTIPDGPATAVYMPLWNHAVSTMASYNMYDSGQAPISGPHATQSTDASVGGMLQPVNVSKLCLSCHDGSVGLNAYGSANMVDDLGGSIGADDVDIRAGVGRLEYAIGADTNGDNIGELSNHHPIGFDYDAVQAADNEIAASSASFGTSGVAISDVLYAGQMECSTCHDVHNSTTGMGEKFLWTTNASSNFCCVCHLKCD